MGIADCSFAGCCQVRLLAVVMHLEAWYGTSACMSEHQHTKVVQRLLAALILPSISEAGFSVCLADCSIVQAFAQAI